MTPASLSVSEPVGRLRRGRLQSGRDGRLRWRHRVGAEVAVPVLQRDRRSQPLVNYRDVFGYYLQSAKRLQTPVLHGCSDNANRAPATYVRGTARRRKTSHENLHGLPAPREVRRD